MITLLAGFLGGVMNRIRGGLFSVPHGRSLNALTFGVIAGLVTMNPYAVPLGALGMYAGQSLGWGRYIGALGGWENKKLEEVKFIDSLIKPFAPTSSYSTTTQTYTHLPKHRLVLWGFLGLALRGFVWSLALILPLSLVTDMEELTVVLVGFLMPVCYKIPQLILRLIGKNDKIMWEVGEIIFGFILWYAAIHFLV